MITQTYNLNLIPEKVPIIVNCSQYDADSRNIEMNIYNGVVPFTIPNGTAVTVRGTKNDNTGFEYPCTFSESVVSFGIQDQMTVFPGKVPCEIRFTNNGILGTCNFILNVEPTTLDSDITISETDLPLLEEAEQNAARAEAAADRAESIVGGKMDYVSSPTANDILLTNANGQAVDSGKKLSDYQPKLTAGERMSISNNTIGWTGLTRTLLWENPDVTVAFANQDISLDLSSYTLVHIMFKLDANSSTYHTSFSYLPLGYSIRHSVVGGDSNAHLYTKLVTVSSSQVRFYDSRYDGAVNNEKMIPFRIYGIK